MDAIDSHLQRMNAGVAALKGVSMKISSGDFVIILGKSGSVQNSFFF